MKALTRSLAAACLLAGITGCGAPVQVSRSAAVPAGYTGVQPVLQTYCAPCHSGALPSAGLTLNAYPFRSTRLASSAAILGAVVTRLQSTTTPMPPAYVTNRPNAADVQRFVAWQTQGGF